VRKRGAGGEKKKEGGGGAEDFRVLGGACEILLPAHC